MAYILPLAFLKYLHQIYKITNRSLGIKIFQGKKGNQVKKSGHDMMIILSAMEKGKENKM